MNLSTVRQDIKTACIEGGIPTVYEFVPARPIPNCAIIEPDSPFIDVQEDQYNFPDYLTNWQVTIIVQFASNQRETTDLDSYLDALVPALWSNTSATTLSVDKPYILEVNNASYLATNINISIDIGGNNG